MTLGFEGGARGSADLSSALQTDGTIQVSEPRRVHRSQRCAANRSQLVTPLLQAAVLAEATRKGETVPHARALTVKEVAGILRVCTATVYAMIERGELPHVRVSNAIRVVVAVNETALDGRPEPRQDG